MSTYNKMHVHIQENACQHTFEISTYMSIKSTCQYTKNAGQHAFFPEYAVSEKSHVNTQPLFLMPTLTHPHYDTHLPLELAASASA